MPMRLLFPNPNRLSIILGLALLIVSRLMVQAQPTVEQWGVFETSLNGPTNGNPFTDVHFSTRFFQGTNAFEVNGFYDGDGTYRVRFMPPERGEWHYVTESSSPELNGHTGIFSVTQPSSDNHGPVMVTNTYHFAYADGTPYEELGTTSYNLLQDNNALEEETLHTLASAPFNKLRLCVFPSDWDTDGTILYPFEGMPPDSWDLSRLNPKFFRHLEQRILDLQKLGIQADVILFDPYDNRLGFDRMPAATDDFYLRYVVARLSAYRNVWWSLANEWDLMREKKESDFMRFGEIVSDGDPYHHLLSIHNSVKIFNNTLPWITHASIQNGSAVESPASAELYRDVYRKPVVYDEVKYEGNIARRWGQLSAQELVFRFWNGTVAGTYVGHGETLSGRGSPLWTTQGGTLKGQSPPRLAFLKKVLDSAPPEGIEPIDKWQNPEYGGQSGKYYLVYLGKQAPKSWSFLLPSQSSSGVRLTNGMQFTAEILDTWNMTITPVKGVLTIQKKTEYFFGDKDNRSIQLPGKPFIAIRITRVAQ
jgi:hypothetical protein